MGTSYELLPFSLSLVHFSNYQECKTKIVLSNIHFIDASPISRNNLHLSSYYQQKCHDYMLSLANYSFFLQFTCLITKNVKIIIIVLSNIHFRNPSSTFVKKKKNLHLSSHYKKKCDWYKLSFIEFLFLSLVPLPIY